MVYRLLLRYKLASIFFLLTWIAFIPSMAINASHDLIAKSQSKFICKVKVEKATLYNRKTTKVKKVEKGKTVTEVEQEFIASSETVKMGEKFDIIDETEGHYQISVNGKKFYISIDDVDCFEKTKEVTKRQKGKPE